MEWILFRVKTKFSFHSISSQSIRAAAVPLLFKAVPPLGLVSVSCMPATYIPEHLCIAQQFAGRIPSSRLLELEGGCPRWAQSCPFCV